MAVPSLDDELRALFAGERLDDPYPVFRLLRDTSGAYIFGSLVLVSAYPDVKDVISDRKRYSAKMHITGSRAEEIVAGLSDDASRLWHDLAAAEASQLPRSDGEQHDRIRAVMHRAFTPRAVAETEGMIEAHASELVDQLRRDGGGDFKRIAQDMAARVIVSILGAPQVDRTRMVDWTDARARFMGSDNEQYIREAHVALGQFAEYVQHTVIGRQCPRAGAESLVSTICSAEALGELTHGEVIQNLLMLMAAGVETTSILLSTGLFSLLSEREHWEFLCADPGRIPRAVEELLRHVSPVQWIQRIAHEDFVLNGTPVRAGQTVLGMAAAANRDPEVFDDPDLLVLDRAATHLSLGYGYKFCLGASLLRLEARKMLMILIDRHPNIELAIDPADVTWSESNPLLRAIDTLPVTLGG